jgi:PilZ domain
MRMTKRIARDRLDRVRDRAQSARVNLAVERVVRRLESADRTAATRGGTATARGPWADEPPARRSAERNSVDGEVSMRRLGSFGFDLPVRDISTAGCKVELVEQVTASDHVITRLPGLEPFGATVMWSDERNAGVRFNRPIHPAVFELLLQRLR